MAKTKEEASRKMSMNIKFCLSIPGEKEEIVMKKDIRNIREYNRFKLELLKRVESLDTLIKRGLSSNDTQTPV